MEIQTLNPATPRQRQRIEAFLKRNALRIDDMNYYAAVLDDAGEMIAGGGLKDEVSCSQSPRIVNSSRVSHSACSPKHPKQYSWRPASEESAIRSRL